MQAIVRHASKLRLFLRGHAGPLAVSESPEQVLVSHERDVGLSAASVGFSLNSKHAHSFDVRSTVAATTVRIIIMIKTLSTVRRKIFNDNVEDKETNKVFVGEFKKVNSQHFSCINCGSPGRMWALLICKDRQSLC